MEYQSRAGASPDESTRTLLEYRNVSVVKGNRTILDNISFSIKLGENVAIIGPNGSGKTSLIKTITREYYPFITEPEPYLSIFGQERWNIFELRRLIGIVTNEMAIECARDRLPVWETVLSSFFSTIGLHHDDVPSPEMREKARQVMELLEIARLKDRNVGEISMGELRRVIIARALVHEPRTLLLDEPTSSLDFRATSELRAVLSKVTASGTSIIMVTHSLPDLIPEISRIILVKDGAIFKDGAKSSVLTSKNLSELFGMNLEILKRGDYYYLVN